MRTFVHVRVAKRLERGTFRANLVFRGDQIFHERAKHGNSLESTLVVPDEIVGREIPFLVGRCWYHRLHGRQMNIGTPSDVIWLRYITVIGLLSSG